MLKAYRVLGFADPSAPGPAGGGIDLVVVAEDLNSAVKAATPDRHTTITSVEEIKCKRVVVDKAKW